MLANALENFVDNVFCFLTSVNKSARGILVKKHCDNFQTHGEFSFPNRVKSWHKFINTHKFDGIPDGSLLQLIDKEPIDLINASIKWELRVGDVREENDRVYLFLERPQAIYVGLLEAFRNNILVSKKLLNECNNNVSIQSVCNDDTLTSLRVKCLATTIRKLCVIYDDRDWPDMIVTSKTPSAYTVKRVLLCGTVLNVKTGVKENEIGAEDFIRIRQNEMTLIALHKHGVRKSMDSKLKEFVSHLGESDVKFELLQTNPTSVVKIDFGSSSTGSSKGASFVLYNCARLETLIRAYDDKVKEGVYPPLPDIECTDFKVLNQEEEWCLVFNFLLGFPLMLKNCIEINEKAVVARPQIICNYLCSMVKVFSQYYRRTRILTVVEPCWSWSLTDFSTRADFDLASYHPLTEDRREMVGLEPIVLLSEPRKHLLPVLFARMHMLKILNDTLKTCLNILNIKSVSQM